MRKWELEDNRAIPSDMVLEQDFILRIRRLNRLGVPQLVVNIALSACDPRYSGRGPLEDAQQRLQNLATTKGGAYAEMSNGDVFLIWPDTNSVGALSDLALKTALPECAFEDAVKHRLVYRLPNDYSALRERANYYIEVSRNAAIVGEAESTPSQLLQTEAARGPLTAWSVDQIGRLLQDIALNRYIRLQPIYERGTSGKWTPLFEECAIGFEDLRRAHFPKMEVVAPEHLFLALCQTLDARLLSELTERFETIAGRDVSLNLSVMSVLGSAFAGFARKVPRDAHGRIGFELNPGDLLQNFALTLSAMNLLRREGFRVIIDGVTPDMLAYVNIAAFGADYIKLNVSKDYAAQLAEASVRKSLSAIPRDKLIFFRCDNERALAAGLDLGVTRFQGWLIDEKTRAQQPA